MTDAQYKTATNSNAHPDTFHRPAYPSPHSELGNVGRALLRGWWIIILCGMVALAVGVGATSRTPTTYKATAYLLLKDSNFEQAVNGASPQVNTQTAQATTIAMLTPQREAQAAQAAGLRSRDSYGVNITAAPNSNVLNVNGTTGNPRTAAALADAAAQQLLSAVRDSNASSLTSARKAVRAQLAAAKRSQKLPLASELNSFQTLEALANQSVEFIQHASVPGVPSGPSKVRNGAVALVLGIILGAALAVLRRGRPEPARV